MRASGQGTSGQRRRGAATPTKKSFAVAIAVAAEGAATHDGVVNASSGPPQHDQSRPARQALADAWLDSRPALVRFLTARTGSSAAAEDLAQDVWVRLQSMTEEAAAEAPAYTPEPEPEAPPAPEATRGAQASRHAVTAAASKAMRSSRRGSQSTNRSAPP